MPHRQCYRYCCSLAAQSAKCLHLMWNCPFRDYFDSFAEYFCTTCTHNERENISIFYVISIEHTKRVFSHHKICNSIARIDSRVLHHVHYHTTLKILSNFHQIPINLIEMCQREYFYNLSYYRHLCFAHYRFFSRSYNFSSLSLSLNFQRTGNIFSLSLILFL
jgi:hypothetical protein